MDDKYYSCFKSDLDKLIIIVDEIGNRSFDHHNTQYSQSYQHQSQHQPQPPQHQSEKPPQPPMRYEDINSHSNRDQIKRTALSKYN